MKRRNWKHWVPRSPADALDGCAQLAMQRYNRGIERLATDHLCQNNASTLYKWMGNGRLPLTMVLSLEKACGLPLITRYLAAAHGKLLVDIPVGKACNASDLQQLQGVLHSATGALMAFYDGKQSAEQTLDAIRAGLESLAWHHGNVAQAETLNWTLEWLTMSEVINLQALLRRLDEQAYEQLCVEAARLAEENEHLRTELTRMEECAEGWCNEAQHLHQQLAEATGGQAAITQSGALVVIPMERCA
ncbi:hypothetical protein P4119_17425 [Pseudomonas aeruginosa]|nr:hypothetical protein [Pseudomonas aeruginosa]